MSVRLLFILLLISVLLAFTPRFRRVGLTACVLLIVLLLWINIREAQQPDEALPASNAQSHSSAASTAIQPRAVIVALQLDGRGAPWHLVGEVQNISAAPVKWVRLNIERFDCPTDVTSLTECRLLWQGEHITRLSIAAGATGKIDESFYSHVAVPLHKGVLRDRITLSDAG